MTLRRGIGRLCGLVVLLGAGLSGASAGAAEKHAATLVVQDVLAAPLKEITIEARLFEPGILRDQPLGGEVIEFFLGKHELPRRLGDSERDERRLGQALTGGDGKAYLQYTPRHDGHFRVRAEFPGSPRAAKAQASAVLASWERRRPILFVEADALMEPRAGSVQVFPGLKLPAGGGTLTEPADEAAAQLERLTRFYFYAVYVVRAPGIELDGFRAWLAEHRFPPGLIRIIGPGEEALEALLERFAQQGFDNIKGGVGRSRDFAEFFASRRRAVVVLSEAGEGGEFPRKTKWAKDWLEVRKLLQG